MNIKEIAIVVAWCSVGILFYILIDKEPNIIVLQKENHLRVAYTKGFEDGRAYIISELSTLKANKELALCIAERYKGG